MNNIVYLNGEYLPIDQAKISVLDRGFLFGDSVYEVISVFNGKPFRPKEHLLRLENSLNAIYLPPPLSIEKWLAILDELLQRNEVGKQNKSIYLQVTRGAEKTRSHGLPKTNINPTIFIMLSDLQQPNYDDLTYGFSIITKEDTRRRDCYIKSTSLLPSILAHQEALEQDANDAIFVRDGHIIEGSSSNLFIVKHGIIITPPKNIHMLGGITRELILELAIQHQIPYQERDITVAELLQADEVWISSSSRDIMPITKVDKTVINDGRLGPLWKKMLTYFREYKNSL